MRYDPENYGSEPWREPKPEEGDTVIFSEFGRVLDKTDCRSHWFMMVKVRIGGYNLLVKHGGGQERIELGYLHSYHRTGETSRIIRAMEDMDTDARYLMRNVSKDKKIVGFDVVELCPIKGQVSSDFLAAKLVYRLLGYVFPMKK